MSQRESQAYPSPLVSRGLAGLAMAIGVMILALSGRAMVEQQRLGQGFWATEGEVVARRVQALGKRGYRPAVTYRYRVGEALIRSDRYAVYPGAMSRAEAEAILREYPQGKAVTVHFNPDRPTEAYLVRHLRFSPFAWALGGVALAALGWWGARAATIMARRKDPAALGRGLALAASASAAIWYLGGALVLWYFFDNHQGPVTMNVWAGIAAYLLSGLITLIGVLRGRQLASAQTPRAVP